MQKLLYLFWKPIERESTKTAPDSAIPANTRIRTLALTTVRDNIVQIRESEGGMASSLWGMYSRLPTLRVLALRLRDVQFWLAIRRHTTHDHEGVKNFHIL